jgi:5-formyltetrahydrofolate cyclo-ligase
VTGSRPPDERPDDRQEREDQEECGGSHPCYLHELGADGAPVDAQQARDVARWRRTERSRLIALRSELPPADRALGTAAIARTLDEMIPAGSGEIVSVYWPIRAEPDLRSWMRQACMRDLRIALPVALQLGQPLKFREWRPDAPMARGLWKIPYPAAGDEVSPTTVLAPVVGFDPACYRLGYGGGFFDRTLAAMARKPTVIGIGYPQLRIPTIFPQRYDIPMDWIVTGSESLRRSA